MARDDGRLDAAWAELAPGRRARAVGGSLREAILALGRDEGVAWLEERVESPVTGEWGATLHALGPRWEQLERWMQRGVPHCIAAADALVWFARERAMPAGATALTIEQALRALLADHGSLRLREAAREIRHAWPAGPGGRHLVEVPGELAAAALILLGDAGRVAAWREAMATALDPPEGALEVWSALLEYGETCGYLAMLDWRAGAEEVGRLRELAGGARLKVAWERLASLQRPLAEALPDVAKAAGKEGLVLVELDQGGDDYALAFVMREDAGRLEGLVVAIGVDDVGVRRVRR